MIITLVRRSVFGEVIDKNQRYTSIDFAHRSSLGIDRLISTLCTTPHGVIGSLDNLSNIVDDVGGLLGELVSNKIQGSEFAQRNPKKEIPRLVDLLLKSRFSAEPVKICAPVCPDDSGIGYALQAGVGPTATKILGRIVEIRDIFTRYYFNVNFEIDLADVEAEDPYILSITGENPEYRLAQIEKTYGAISHEIRSMGLNHFVTVGMMSDRFSRIGESYRVNQGEISRNLMHSGNPEHQRVIDLLLKERLRIGDLKGVDKDLQQLVVVGELAGYAAYGRVLAGDAIIASPDAMSAIPAYHFAVRGAEDYCPVIYIKK